MGILTTRGIVLRTTAFGDTSQIVQMLTEEHGRIGLVARGSRKKPGAPAPFQQGMVTFHHKTGRDLQAFKEFTVAHPRLGLSRAMHRFGGAALMVELILRTSGEDSSGGSFRALAAALEALDTSEDSDEVWMWILCGAWRIVRTLGYAPGLDRCAHCGEQPERDEMLRFDMKAGALVCQRCGSDALPRVGPKARAHLQWFLGSSDTPCPGLESAHWKPHLVLLGDFVTYHITGDPPLRSLTTLMDLLSNG